MRQVALFLVAGGIAALANVLARIGFSTFMPYVPAIVLAYCIGMVTAFVLNRALVFKDATNRFREQALWFVAINLAAVAQTVAVSLLLSRWIFPALGFASHADTMAHVAGVLVPVFTSYFGHKHLSFRSRITEEPEH